MKKKVFVFIISMLVVSSLSANCFAEAASPSSSKVNAQNGIGEYKEIAEEDPEFLKCFEQALKEKEERLANKQYLDSVSSASSIDLNIKFVRKQNDYYCGPATAVMILGDFMYVGSQNEMAAYLRTDTNGTPWYSGDGSHTALRYYNMPYGLNMWQYDQLGQMLYPYYKYTSGNLISYIMDTLECGFGVPLNGCSKDGNTGYIKRHPGGHWLVLEGYTNSGSSFLVVDPASGLSGYTDIPPKYDTSKANINEYITFGVVC